MGPSTYQTIVNRREALVGDAAAGGCGGQVEVEDELRVIDTGGSEGGETVRRMSPR